MFENFPPRDEKVDFIYLCMKIRIFFQSKLVLIKIFPYI